MSTEDDEIDALVRQHGWQALYIDDKPPFLYTVGLCQTQKHPELIVFGWNSRNSQGLANWLVGLIREGRRFDEPGICREIVNGDTVEVAHRPVHPTQHQFYVGYAMAFERRHLARGDLKVVQIFWPDLKGRYPFDAGCEESVFYAQPRLDVPKTPREIAEFERLWK